MKKSHDELIDIFDEVFGIHGCWNLRYNVTPSMLHVGDIHNIFRITTSVKDGTTITIYSMDLPRTVLSISEFVNLYRTDLSDADKLALILKYT